MKVGSRYACLSAAVIATLYGHSAVQARDLVWDPSGSTTSGSDGSGNWDLTTASWYDPTAGLTTFANGDSAQFGTDTTLTAPAGAVSTPNNVFLSASLTAQNITFATAAGPTYYNILDQGGSETLTLAGNITKTSALGGSQIQLTNAINLTAGTHTINVNDTGGDDAPELAINSAMTGAGGITINNGANSIYGTTAFNVDNTYTGVTNITYGRLEITTSNGLGSTAGGTVIGAGGNLALGGSNQVPGNLNIGENITITRNTYTGTNSGEYPDAITATNIGGAHTQTFSGTLTIDSTDARIAANTNTLNITKPLVAGSDVAAGAAVVTFDGDFAGFVNLQGDNTAYGAAGNAIQIIGGVEVGASSEANFGGPTSKLILNGGSIHPTGALATSAFMTNFGAHVLSGNISTGVNIDAGNTFTVNNLNGDAIGTRGAGTINFNGTNTFTGVPFFDAGVVNINGSTTLGGFRLRSSTLNVGNDATLTLSSAFSDIGSDSPDNGTVNLTGNGQIINNGIDFNVTDNAGTNGTLNIGGTSTLTTAGGLFVGKASNVTATVNQSGGTVNANRGGQFSLDIGGRSDNGGTNVGTVGVYTKTGGTLNVAGEMYAGNQIGTNGTFSQSAGATTVNSWLVAGRGGATGTINLTGGTFTRQGGGNSFLGENINTVTSTMTVSGTGVFNDVAGGGEFWVGQAGGSGILNIGTAAGQASNADSAASFTVNNWLALGRASGSSVGVLNLYGGTLTKVAGSPGFFAIGSGGSGTFNQTGGIASIDGTRLGEASSGTANITGGTDVFTGEFSLGYTDGGVGTLNIGGTANVTLPSVVIGVNGSTATAGGVLNLNGGTLTATQFTAGAAATRLSQFTFNGGTLLAAGDQANFVDARVASIDSTGGAKIGPNGHAITVNSALTHDATLTGADGGLTVSGTTGGTLTLAAANTYTGPTAVTGTTNLAIASTGSISTSTLNSTTAIANAGTITESGGGSISSVTGAGTLNVTGGTLELVNPTLGTVNSESALNITNGGVLDIHKNQFQVATGQYTALSNYYKAGSLISSNAAAAPSTRIVGIVDNGTTTTARYTTFGDVNLDGKFNGSDLALINGANAFGKPAGSATYATGDTNYDGRFNGADLSRINAANSFGTGLIPNVAFGPTASPLAIAQNTDNTKINLQYDPATGDLKVITDGVGYGTITLSASSSVFKDGVFGTSPEFYSDDNGDGTSLIFGVLVGQQTADVTLPGVLDPNQSLASLLSAITVDSDTNGPAVGNITFSSTGGTSTPEPTALAAVALAGGGLLRRRRM